ncbi:MAG: hypothetical protein PHR69_09465 [Sphaerochaeta sp.]|nr:hypothetical protein [Sphaerochaeta sp.]
MTRQERLTWQHVFGTPDGKAVLTDILNRLGFFADNPNAISPELTATANWMLGRLGACTLPNLTKYVDAIVDCASTDGTYEGEPDA